MPLLEQHERSRCGVVGRPARGGVTADRGLQRVRGEQGEEGAGRAPGSLRRVGAHGVRERGVRAGRAARVARHDDAQAARRARRPGASAARRGRPGRSRPWTGYAAGRRAAHDGGGVGRAVVVPALADRHGLLAARDLGCLPERRLALADAAGDEVAAAGAARAGDQSEGGGDVGGRAAGDAGRISRRADEHVVAVEHEAPGRLERGLGGDERRLGGRAVGERELRLAGAHVAQRLGSVGAHVAHRDALAARGGDEHGAHESRLGERRRALDGHAARGAAGARRCGKHRCDEQAGEQASHARTLRARARPVKLGPSSLARMAPRVRDDLPHAVRVVETEWIPLSDGTRLAARLWLPEGAGHGAGRSSSTCPTG